ncbi:MAG: hypothetical protein H6727_20860 [Myxococcales bacterium]|nr:hypothetical protein [Myxococcales bacterium]
MTQRKPFQRIFSLVLLCSVLFPLLTAAQCLQNANIPIPIKRDFELDVDIDKFASESLSKSGVQKTPEGKIPDGAPDVSVPVEVEQLVDLTDNPDVQKYGSALKHVKINSVKVTALENTVNVALPTLTLKMSDKDKSNEQEVGSLRSINPGETGVIDDMIKTEAQKDAAGRYIVKFAFNLKALAQYTLKAGMKVPKGKMKLKISIDVVLSLNPFAK